MSDSLSSADRDARIADGDGMSSDWTEEDEARLKEWAESNTWFGFRLARETVRVRAEHVELRVALRECVDRIVSLTAELRAALSREAALDDALDYERRKDRSEAIKDAGRMDYLEAHLERLTVTRFAEPVGGRSVVVGLSHSPSPDILAGAGGDSIREAADRAMSFFARSVSLSENG